MRVYVTLAAIFLTAPAWAHDKATIQRLSDQVQKLCEADPRDALSSHLMQHFKINDIVQAGV